MNELAWACNCSALKRETIAFELAIKAWTKEHTGKYPRERNKIDRLAVCRTMEHFRKMANRRIK
jgi:hypothetical protein